MSHQRYIFEAVQANQPGDRLLSTPPAQAV